MGAGAEEEVDLDVPAVTLPRVADPEIVAPHVDLAGATTDDDLLDPNADLDLDADLPSVDLDAAAPALDLDAAAPAVDDHAHAAAGHRTYHAVRPQLADGRGGSGGRSGRRCPVR